MRGSKQADMARRQTVRELYLILRKEAKAQLIRPAMGVRSLTAHLQ